MFKETLISIGVLLSLVSSLYFIKCGCRTDNSYIDVKPIVEESE